MFKKVGYLIGGVFIILALYQHVTNDIGIFHSDVHSIDQVQEAQKSTAYDPAEHVEHLPVFNDVKKQLKQQSISQVIADMSVEEKVGQMIIAGITGTKMNTTIKKLISDIHVGGLIFYEDSLKTPDQTIELLNDIKQVNEQDSVPLLLSIDQEGGRISKLPGNIAQLPTNQEIGEVNNSTFSYKIGRVLGQQVKAFGFNVDYAPVLDINSNPNNPVIGDRSFANEHEIVSKLGIQTMKGIQSQHVIPVIKHFPGHGDTSVDSHLALPKIDKSLEELHQSELIPFKKAIEAGADVVMVAHILLSKLDEVHPATMSKFVINDMLREELQFDGVVITDDMTMRAITDNYDIAQAVVKSVEAGTDIVMVAHEYKKVISAFNALKTAVQNGDLSEDRIDQSVTRILQLKRKYNISNKQVGEVNIPELNQEIDQVIRTYRE